MVDNAVVGDATRKLEQAKASLNTILLMQEITDLIMTAEQHKEMSEYIRNAIDADMILQTDETKELRDKTRHVLLGLRMWVYGDVAAKINFIVRCMIDASCKRWALWEGNDLRDGNLIVGGPFHGGLFSGLVPFFDLVEEKVAGTLSPAHVTHTYYHTSLPPFANTRGLFCYVHQSVPGTKRAGFALGELLAGINQKELERYAEANLKVQDPVFNRAEETTPEDRESPGAGNS